MLRKEIVGFDGKTVPLKLRYYQVQGVYHMLTMRRMVLGDGTGLGKSLQTIATLCYIWMKEPNSKAIICAPKSALRQWAAEFDKFATGIKPIVATGTAAQRKAAYEAWANAPTGPDDPKVVLVMNYAILVRDWDAGAERVLLPNGKPDPKAPVIPGLLDGITSKVPNLITIFDESQAFKSMTTKTWQTCRFLSDRSSRVYGLTATLLKNRLEEGFSIYKVVKPDIFTTKTKFMEDFCVTKPLRNNSYVKIIVGYKNLGLFREKIDPFFLGRSKHEVSSELPALTTKEIVCELTPAEDAKYEEALSGVLELGDGTVKDYEENKALVSLIYCQQIVNSLALLKYKDGDEVQASIIDDKSFKLSSLSSKEQALMDLLSEELDGEKVIVYTRFASHVPRLVEILKKNKIKSVAITGKVNDKVRKEAQDAFQDLKSDTRVIFITGAGTEAINLQAASAMVFLDAPWSWGDYVQAIGRLIRIGSPHTGVNVYHLMAERPSKSGKDTKTIDHHTLNLLQAKKDLIDKVIGEAAVGALEFEGKMSMTKDLVKALQG